MSPERAWDAYWGEQRLAACLRDQEGNYGGCIGDAWSQFFISLSPGSRILDLASGNGAIALLGLKASDKHQLEFSIEACDAARIDPARHLPELAERLSRIDFQGGVLAEQLPYQDNRFDALSSQYGIEYSDWQRALKEVDRVLKPGGQLMLICHRSGSSVHETTKVQLRALARLRQRGLTGHVRSLLDSEAAGGSLFQENLHRFRQQAAAVMQELDQSDEANRVFIGHYLQRLGEIFQQRRERLPQESSGALEALESDLGLHESRLQALHGAALTNEDIDGFVLSLEQLGFCAIQSGPLADLNDGNVLGWRFRARKGEAHA